MFLRAAVLLLFFLAASSPRVVCAQAHAGSEWIRRVPLHFLGSEINVVVEEIREELTNVGVSEETVKAQVELSLRRMNFEVLDSHNWLQSRNQEKGSVVVLVNGGRAPNTFVAYVEIKVTQNAVLGGFAVPLSVITWSSGTLLVGGDIRARIFETLDSKLMKLNNDYLAARDIDPFEPPEF